MSAGGCNETSRSDRRMSVSIVRRAMPALRLFLITAVVAAFVSGCTGSNRSTGTISGTAEPCIGPAIPNGHYTVRFVNVTQGSHTVASRRNLTRPYRFTFQLSPGLYRVSAASDGSVRVRVAAGRTTKVALHNSCT